jgi:hypothetical protein
MKKMLFEKSAAREDLRRWGRLPAALVLDVLL